MQHCSDDQSLSGLLAELSRQTSALVRQEVAIARTEIMQKAYGIGKDIGFLAVGGAAAYAGLLAIIAAAIIALRKTGLSWWLSALIVGVVVAVVGYVLVQRGLTALKEMDPAPRQTIETLKEDAEWAKEQTR